MVLLLSDGMPCRVSPTESMRLASANVTSCSRAGGMSWHLPGDGARITSPWLILRALAGHVVLLRAQRFPLPRAVWHAMSCYQHANGSGARRSLACHVVCVAYFREGDRAPGSRFLACHVTPAIMQRSTYPNKGLPGGGMPWRRWRQ